MTTSLRSKIEKILPHVEKPSRYINQEYNAYHKPHQKTKVKVALAYPDVYEVGASNLGLQILYQIINSCQDIVAERVYAPWSDMEEKLRQKKIPLFSLESTLPISDFDILGFSLQAELTYTNILNMLDLASIPLRASERSDEHPLVIGGGPCVFNPEPLADFFDCFVLGEAEEAVLEIAEAFKKVKAKRPSTGTKRQKLLEKLAQIKGVYVPSFYEVSYLKDGRVKEAKPKRDDVPAVVTKRIIKDFNKATIAIHPIVPFVDTIHNRYSLEIMRGCTRGCRFCQAGMIYRPVRQRQQKLLVDKASEALKNTGFEEVSLVSLSSTDYSSIEGLVDNLVNLCRSSGTSVSLPSLRVDAFSVKLANQISQIKRTGLTFAPETGTERLACVINKGVKGEDLLAAARCAFEEGWQRLKLYFMIGLPTEAQEDLQGIVDLASKVVELGLKIVPRKKRSRFLIVVSVSSFVPKAQTPFQWFSQNSLREIETKQQFLKEHLRGRYISLKWHDPEQSLVEGVLARGDRKLSEALEEVFKQGAKFDSWNDFFNLERWLKALEVKGFSADFYTSRRRQADEVFPWDHLSCGVSKNFLLSEYEKAMAGAVTKDCRVSNCSACGVDKNLKVKCKQLKKF